ILSRRKASAERVNEVLTLENESESEYEVDRTHDNIEIKDGTVEYRNVYFQYPASDEIILNDISFTIQSGETLAIMGATGSGKTSIFQLMPRLYDPTKGQVLIDGRSI